MTSLLLVFLCQDSSKPDLLIFSLFLFLSSSSFSFFFFLLLYQFLKLVQILQYLTADLSVAVLREWYLVFLPRGYSTPSAVSLSFTRCSINSVWGRSHHSKLHSDLKTCFKHYILEPEINPIYHLKSLF